MKTIKIKYLLDGIFCKTDCPYGKEITWPGGGYAPAVSSYYCKNECKHFVYDDEANSIVECSYQSEADTESIRS